MPGACSGISKDDLCLGLSSTVLSLAVAIMKNVKSCQNVNYRSLEPLQTALQDIIISGGRTPGNVSNNRTYNQSSAPSQSNRSRTRSTDPCASRTKSGGDPDGLISNVSDFADSVDQSVRLMTRYKGMLKEFTADKDLLNKFADEIKHEQPASDKSLIERIDAIWSRIGAPAIEGIPEINNSPVANANGNGPPAPFPNQTFNYSGNASGGGLNASMGPNRPGPSGACPPCPNATFDQNATFNPNQNATFNQSQNATFSGPRSANNSRSSRGNSFGSPSLAKCSPRPQIRAMQKCRIPQRTVPASTPQRLPPRARLTNAPRKSKSCIPSRATGPIPKMSPFTVSEEVERTLPDGTVEIVRKTATSDEPDVVDEILDKFKRM